MGQVRVYATYGLYGCEGLIADTMTQEIDHQAWLHTFQQLLNHYLDTLSHFIDMKREAIFMHESQKDEALFPGSDPREFWQRAEERNKGTAEKYNQIGLPEYFALEAFTRWKGNAI